MNAFCVQMAVGTRWVVRVRRGAAGAAGVVRRCVARGPAVPLRCYCADCLSSPGCPHITSGAASQTSLQVRLHYETV